jgi:DNA polymerase-3 subunit beta
MSRIVLPHDVIPVLSGALLEFGPETLTLTASDRFRVAIRELTWKPTDELPDRVVVPARLLADATKGLGGVDTVHIGASATDESLVSIGSDDRLTTMRLLDDTYPPLRSKVPTEFSGAVTVRVDELRAALRRVCIVADRYAAVVLTMASGEVTVGAAGDVDTRGRERLQARLDGAGGAVAFNAGYLLDGLDGLDTPYARLSFNEGMRPALLTGCDELDGEDARDHVYVVMPRRSTGDRT